MRHAGRDHRLGLRHRCRVRRHQRHPGRRPGRRQPLPRHPPDHPGGPRPVHQITLQLLQPEDGIRAFVEEKVQDGEVRREAEAVGKHLEIRAFQAQGRQDRIGPLGMDVGAEIIRPGHRRGNEISGGLQAAGDAGLLQQELCQRQVPVPEEGRLLVHQRK